MNGVLFSPSQVRTVVLRVWWGIAAGVLILQLGVVIPLHHHPTRSCREAGCETQTECPLCLAAVPACSVSVVVLSVVVTDVSVSVVPATPWCEQLRSLPWSARAPPSVC